jgi:sugar O-acyltransferase (sialic acid O-acetyltransferase NeuD family)
MRGLILLGGGGHCASCIEVIESTGQWSIKGIVDLPSRRRESLLGYPFIGSDEDLGPIAEQFKNFLVTVGQVRDADVRTRLFERGTAEGGAFAVIVAASAVVSRHAELGDGTIVMHGAFVNARGVVGRNCIVNSAALVEHDAVIGDHCHISTSAVVNGSCVVGGGCLIGSGAVLLQGVRVAAGSIIGAGSVVIRSIEEKGTYAGCPARKIG